MLTLSQPRRASLYRNRLYRGCAGPAYRGLAALLSANDANLFAEGRLTVVRHVFHAACSGGHAHGQPRVTEAGQHFFRWGCDFILLNFRSCNMQVLNCWQW